MIECRSDLGASTAIYEMRYYPRRVFEKHILYLHFDVNPNTNVYTTPQKIILLATTSLLHHPP
jgi:hypothetical protein